MKIGSNRLVSCFTGGMKNKREAAIMKIKRIELHKVGLSLMTPYYLSFYTFESFEPIYTGVWGADGSVGWGEAQISPGASKETREGGWKFLSDYCEKLVGMESSDAKALVFQDRLKSRVAATGLLTAIEMLEESPLLKLAQDTQFPLLTPFNSKDPDGIRKEAEQRIAQGFRCVKIKIGEDLEADLSRVRAIQDAIAGRATIRIDANCGFTREAGICFASQLKPQGIEHLEQPCKSDAWEDNEAVARESTVPLMLDESISTIQDIERAGTIKNVGSCKVKLKRFGTLENLKNALGRIKGLGMRAIVGDGTSSDVGNWMEACVARAAGVDTAGEYTGFLKTKVRVLKNPMPFEQGRINLKAGYWPEIEREVLAKYGLDSKSFAASNVSTQASSAG